MKALDKVNFLFLEFVKFRKSWSKIIIFVLLYCYRKPSEIYSDKHTLVEVTVHRRPKQKPESKKSWSESLSDSESVVFKKPSQSKSRSPRVVKRINNFHERGKENLNSRKLCEKSDDSELTELIEKLKLELEKSKSDSTRYKSEYQILVKQVSIREGDN